MFHKHPTFFLANLISLTVLAGAFQTAQAQSAKLTEDLSRNLNNYSLINAGAGLNLRQTADSKTLSLKADGRDFDLLLQPNDLRSPRYRAEETGPNGNKNIPFKGVNTFKGKVAGDNSSSVRLSIDGGIIEGYFFSGSDKFFIEPASHFSKEAGASDLVVYRAEDLLHHQSISCDMHVTDKMASASKFVGESALSELIGFKVIEIATDADFEFVSDRGSSAAANADILNTLNMIEGVYEQQLGLTIDVTFQHTWTTADPFAGGTRNIVLSNFQTYWNTNFPQSQTPRDTAHLFSAKANVAGLGVAFVAVICNNPNASYGLTGKFDFTPTKYMLTAHEIGHNLSAVHVDAAQNCANSVMNAILSTETPFNFCAQSRIEVRTHVANNGGCLSEQRSEAARFDFDGDSKADLAVFRPSNGGWYILNSASSSFTIFVFGQAGDKPVSADYDGDGKSDAAVYRDGAWFRIKSANGTVDGINFGDVRDIPAQGDFDGDGKADVAVYRPTAVGTLYYWPSSSDNFAAVQFGSAGDVPVTGDYDGDGKADVAVYRPSNGAWYRYNSSDGAFVANVFGAPEDEPQVGDFDADGKDDLTVYRPSNGAWFTFLSATNTTTGVLFGASGDKPVPADFDGDGKTDVAVFRPRDGNWYRLNSSDGSFQVYAFGADSDIPVQAR